MSKREPLDWERIEREYRAGQFSISEIARRHGCRRETIIRKAKCLGWQRDLTDDVRRRTQEKLVTGSVTGVNAREAVEEAAETAASVVTCHRRDVGAIRAECAALLAELRDFQANLGDLDEGTRIKVFSARSQVLRDLSTALARVVPLERQAYSLDPRGAEGADDDGPRAMSDEDLDARIQELAGKADAG